MGDAPGLTELVIPTPQREPAASAPPPLLLVLEVDPMSEDVEDYIYGTGSTRRFTHILLADAPMTDSEFLNRAQRLSALCREEGLGFLVESRMGTARFTGADGLHLPTAKPSLPWHLLRSYINEPVPEGAAPPGVEPVVTPAADDEGVDGADTAAAHGGNERLLGCVINNLAEATTAAENDCDYVVVDAGISDPGACLTEEDAKTLDISTTKKSQDPGPFNANEHVKKNLLAIRRVLHTPEGKRVTLVASHELCMLLGGGVYSRGLTVAIEKGADGAIFVASRALAQMRQALEERQKAAAEAAARKNVLAPSGRVAGAAALIAGGTVGAGIIALPVKTAAAGFVPSAIALVGVWCFMNATAFLLLEMSLWYGPKANVTTMALNTLGRPMKFVCAFLYLFIYLATLTAYIAEGASLSRGVVAAVSTFAGEAAGGGLGATLAGVATATQNTAVWFGGACCAAFTLFFGGFVFAGPEPTDTVNSICLVFAIAAYVLLVGIAAGSIRGDLLMRMDWAKAVGCLPIMVVALTFHNIVPSMLSYLGTAKRVVTAVLLGSGVPLLMYLIWQMAILGTVDLQAAGASGAPASGNQVMEALKESAGAFANECVRFFSLFAIITSFLGVLLGFTDFLLDLFPAKKAAAAAEAEEEASNGADDESAAADAAAEEEACEDEVATAAERKQAAARLERRRRLVAVCSALGAPVVVASLCPTIFLPALEFSGSFRLVLFGLLPAMMVWSGRYNGLLGRGRKAGKSADATSLRNKPWLPGGKPLLVGVAGAALTVLAIEWRSKLAMLAAA